MISLKNVTKYYTVQGKRKLILDNLSINIKKGESLGLMGANGAGKSTLLRLIAGTELPNKGKITSTASISWPLGLASGFQPYLTGKENLQFLCRLYSNSRKEMLKKIAFVEEFCELGDYFYMPMSTYSSGMKSRLGFGASLAFDFDFYIIDESMGTGDANFKRKCDYYFNKRISTASMILVSHNTSTIEKFCNYAIYLEKGKLSIYYDIEKAIEHYNNEFPEGASYEEERKNKKNRL